MTLVHGDNITILLLYSSLYRTPMGNTSSRWKNIRFEYKSSMTSSLPRFCFIQFLLSIHLRFIYSKRCAPFSKNRSNIIVTTVCWYCFSLSGVLYLNHTLYCSFTLCEYNFFEQQMLVIIPFMLYLSGFFL